MNSSGKAKFEAERYEAKWWNATLDWEENQRYNPDQVNHNVVILTPSGT
jgi:hypothetical protein